MDLTTVSAVNIVKLDGSKLASGTLAFLATDQNDKPISFQMGGGGQVVRGAFSAAITNGAVTPFTVPDPSLTSPSGIYYRVTVMDSSTGRHACAAASSVRPSVRTTQARSS